MAPGVIGNLSCAPNFPIDTDAEGSGGCTAVPSERLGLARATNVIYLSELYTLVATSIAVFGFVRNDLSQVKPSRKEPRIIPRF